MGGSSGVYAITSRRIWRCELEGFDWMLNVLVANIAAIITYAKRKLG